MASLFVREETHVTKRRKTVEQLLGDLIWQGAVQVYFLKVISEQGATNMADITTILEKVSAIEGNTANVERVLGTLNTEITALQQQVADLIAAGSGATPAQLAEIDTRLAAADAAMDSLTGDAPVA